MNGTGRRKSRRESSIESLRRASISSLQAVKGYFSKRRQSSSLTADNIYESSVLTAVRNKVLDAIMESEGSFDARDVGRVKSSDVFLARFVLEKLKDCPEEDIVGQAANMVIECLKWRKSYGVNDLKAEDFPRELFEAGIMAAIDGGPGQDIHVFVCGRRYRKVAGWTDVVVKFIVFCFERIEARLDRRQAKIFIDAGGTGLAQSDISLGLAILNIWLNYYPGVTAVAHMVDLPWICKAALHVCLKILPARLSGLVVISDSKSMLAQYGPTSLVDHMGGTAVMPAELDVRTWCPLKAKTMEQVGLDHGISDKNVQLMKEYFVKAKTIK
ncbi:Motile sperm domain-containing protein 2 [Halotydeus destructor]|nr:Motile sperm domain-containing protein 2 [Halotydeus destructor]